MINVIRPAILWNDGRTSEETEYLNKVIGKDKLSQYTANIAFAGFTAPKILWMQKNEPENFAKVEKIMLPKDYLAYRFRILLHRCIRCFRYASSGCKESLLVKGNAGDLWISQRNSFRSCMRAGK